MHGQSRQGQVNVKRASLFSPLNFPIHLYEYGLWNLISLLRKTCLTRFFVHQNAAPSYSYKQEIKQ